MFLFRKKSNTGMFAKQRLQSLLISDKTNFLPAYLESIKEELVKVLSRYMEVDTTFVELQYCKTETEKNEWIPAILARIPLRRYSSKRI